MMGSREDRTALGRGQVSVTEPFVPLEMRGIRRYSSQGGALVLLFFALCPASDFWFLRVNPQFLWVLGAFLGLSGLGLRLSARGFAKNDSFVWAGPYRYVRNPVELGAILAYAGAAFALLLAPWAIVTVLIFAFVYMSVLSKSYEDELLLQMGPAYLKYCRRVRRWIPSMLPGVNRSHRYFSLKLALGAEKDSLLWLLGFALVYAFRMRYWQL